jgi:hypothetical protein
MHRAGIAATSDHRSSVGRVTKITHLPSLTAIMVIPDAALELSLDQLIGALDRKLFMECGRVQSTISPTSRALVATLTAEVRSQDPKEDFGC